jgi:hypothetical protein
MQSILRVTALMGIMTFGFSVAHAQAITCPSIDGQKLLATCDQIVENSSTSGIAYPTVDTAICIYTGFDNSIAELRVKGSYTDIMPADTTYPERRIVNQVDSFLENNVPTNVEYKVSVSMGNDQSISATAIERGGDWGTYDEYKRFQKLSADRKSFTEINFWRGHFSAWSSVRKFSLKCSPNNQ